MSVTHHPTEATLLDHAAGRLPPASAAVVAAHLEVCAQCRGLARLGAAIGGAVLDGLQPEAMAPDALALALARLERPAPPMPPPAPALPPLDGVVLPRVVQRIAARRGGLPRWRWLAPGIQRIAVLREKQAGMRSALYLLKLSPGTAIPDHGHAGGEMAFVLAGSYSDALGRFRPGDLAETGPEVEHQPVADPGAPCICLIATEAPLRFHSRTARLLQSMIGF